MPKFFVSNNQIENQKINIIGEDVNHIANVLRLKETDKIIICDKEKHISYNSIIDEIKKEIVKCTILNKIEETTEANVSVTIYQGLPKAEKMEYIIQKSTELGVEEIIPVAMKRCIVKIEGKDEKKKIDRWQKIAEVAAKQSGRDIIPKIEKIQTIKQISENIQNYDLFIIAYEDEKERSLKNELKKLEQNKLKESKQDRTNVEKTKNIKIGVLIGPEGGLEKEEVELLKQKGAVVVSLGKRILRTETASLVILSNIIYEYDL